MPEVCFSTHAKTPSKLEKISTLRALQKTRSYRLYLRLSRSNVVDCQKIINFIYFTSLTIQKGTVSLLSSNVNRGVSGHFVQ